MQLKRNTVSHRLASQILDFSILFNHVISFTICEGHLHICGTGKKYCVEL